ncbi:hypothetical protein [Stackebrandtia soli]|uniref:hypothetical protein n=1 Tax=Stackebrandtia soli TaxID=1892856 RepID=UPI0039EA9E00
MEIKLEKQGRILSGPFEGYFVKLHEDPQWISGYYILLVNDLENPTDGGDDWVKDWEDLEEYVRTYRWEIEWLE